MIDCYLIFRSVFWPRTPETLKHLVMESFLNESFDHSSRLLLTQVNATTVGLYLSPITHIVLCVLAVIYYVCLLSFGLLGNAMIIVIVIVIVRHRNTARRQSVADVFVCLLAVVDLLSIICIHPPTIVSMVTGGRSATTGMWCAYQAFSCSIYLKLQFLIQVCEVDNYLIDWLTPYNGSIFDYDFTSRLRA